MLSLAADVGGLRTLDVGCGEGRFSRMLAERGAVATGIDIVPFLISEAIRLHPEGRYEVCSAESLPFENDSFDLVVSYITLVDIPDIRAAISEMTRVLKPGGNFLVANIVPFTSACPEAWFSNERGERLHVQVDNYFNEAGQVYRWAGMEIVNFHRPLEAYLSTYLQNGLTLLKYLEPRPSAEDIDRHPTMAVNLRVPYFDVMLWQKN